MRYDTAPRFVSPRPTLPRWLSPYTDFPGKERGGPVRRCTYASNNAGGGFRAGSYSGGEGGIASPGANAGGGQISGNPGDPGSAGGLTGGHGGNGAPPTDLVGSGSDSPGGGGGGGAASGGDIGFTTMGGGGGGGGGAGLSYSATAATYARSTAGLNGQVTIEFSKLVATTTTLASSTNPVPLGQGLSPSATVPATSVDSAVSRSFRPAR